MSDTKIYTAGTAKLSHNEYAEICALSKNAPHKAFENGKALYSRLDIQGRNVIMKTFRDMAKELWKRDFRMAMEIHKWGQESFYQLIIENHPLSEFPVSEFSMTPAELHKSLLAKLNM